MTSITPVAWSVVFFVLFLTSQRWLQSRLQTFLLALTRDPKVTLAIYALLLAPGVMVHELSHLLAAWALGVRTISFSIVPKIASGDRLRLGYVETERTDPVRSALIGAAPFVSGVVLVSLLTLKQLALAPIVDAAARSDPAGVLRTIAWLPRVPDVWLWIYLVVAISNTMLPSASDRSAWLPAAAFVLVMASVAAWAGLDIRGAGWLADLAQALLPRLGAAFGLTACLNLTLAVVFLIAGGLVMRLRQATLD